MIIAQQGFRDEEYQIPKKIFEENGFEVVTASKNPGECIGKLGAKATADISLEDINMGEYEAVVFVGGPGAKGFQHDVQAHMTAQEAVNYGKVLAAICIAPTILGYAGLLEGKKVTSWNKDGQIKPILESQGAEFTGAEVEIDGNLITASGPETAEKFAKTIVAKLKGD